MILLRTVINGLNDHSVIIVKLIITSDHSGLYHPCDCGTLND